MAGQTVSGAVATRDRDTKLVAWIRDQQDDIAMAAATHIRPATIVRVTQGALRRNDKLMAAAIANPQSLLYALLECARLGHEPDTDEYYLVPFGSEVTGIEGYKGIIERMFRAGGVSSVVAQVVRQRDRYAGRGENTPPLHEYDEFASADDRGPLRGAYAYAIFPGGRCSQVIRMGRAEIMEHKAKSRGSDKADSPWQQWEAAMWKKTALRALEPYVPTSAEYRNTNNMAPPAAPAVAAALVDSTPQLHAREIIHARVIEDTGPDPAVQQQAAPPAAAQEPAKPAQRGGRRRQAGTGDRRGEARDEDRGMGADRVEPSGSQRTDSLHSEDPGPGQPPAQPETAASTADPQLISTITGHLERLGYSDDEQEQRLQAVSVLTGREITSAADLKQGEARAVANTLSRCKDRSRLIEVLVAAEKAGSDDGGSDG